MIKENQKKFGEMFVKRLGELIKSLNKEAKAMKLTKKERDKIYQTTFSLLKGKE